MTELAGTTSDYSVLEREPPELMAANLRVGARLWASATVFFFFAFLFAYFYLRSLDSHGLWRPKHIDPPQTIGVLVTLAIVVGAVLVRLGYRDHVADRRPAWRIKGVVASVVFVVAIVLQIAGFATQGFGPTDGGYASVYVGWTAFYVLFLAGTVFWAETILATSLRYRKIPSGAPSPGEASGDSYREAHDIRDPLSLVRPGLETLSSYATFLAGIGVLSWIVLYLL
jgi:heme/copper-type cytochrome/quinol oxidase subunit 3